VVREQLADSAHDLSDGGLAVAVAECSFGPAGVGARLELDSELRPEFLLFHEGPSRILISTTEPDRVMAIAARYGVEARNIGETIKGRIEIRNRGARLGAWDIESLKAAYENALEAYVR
jgi:phosphoribosylformylglycinamidine synthase